MTIVHYTTIQFMDYNYHHPDSPLQKIQLKNGEAVTIMLPNHITNPSVAPVSIHDLFTKFSTNTIKNSPIEIGQHKLIVTDGKEITGKPVDLVILTNPPNPLVSNTRLMLTYMIDGFGHLPVAIECDDITKIEHIGDDVITYNCRSSEIQSENLNGVLYMSFSVNPHI